MKKLWKLGIGGLLIKWILNFLFNRKQSIVRERVSSNQSDVRGGVPQGTVLGPLLFILLMGDIDTGVQHATALPFVDDTRITMKVKQPEDYKRLQEDLNVIYKWYLFSLLDEQFCYELQLSRSIQQIWLIPKFFSNCRDRRVNRASASYAVRTWFEYGQGPVQPIT